MVGGEGNEGKTFFQNQIEEQYGKHRVCTVTLTAKSKDILHHMRKVVDIPTDIFMFNIEKNVNIDKIDYNLLENIKDGKAVATKFDTTIVRFTTPNV